MKIIKRLLVDGEEYKLIDDDVRLNLKRPGRACFKVQANKPLEGLVILDTGWSDSKLHRFFIGFIDGLPTTVSPGEQLIFCRELSAALNRDLLMGLRHVSAKDVLARINKETDLSFTLPGAGYMQKQSPYFHHCGGGYQAMDAIGPVYEIPNYIWQQQGDGSIYAGSWNDSRWADKPVSIPDNVFTNHLAQNSAILGMIPALRPGVKFNRGIITALQLKEENMVITWKKQSAAFS